MTAKRIWNASCVRTLKLKFLINRSRVCQRKRPATPPIARLATEFGARGDTRNVALGIN